MTDHAANDLYDDVVPSAKEKHAAANGHGDLGETRVVVLAGGRGTRLAPYTSILPKPLMPVGDRAILEIVVEQLAACGVRTIDFCVGHLAHLIKAVFDHRAANHDLKINYVHEQEALGTAAPLRLVEGLDDTFIAMNGDVLTTLDFRALVEHHRSAGNVLTIATNERSIKIDYGLLHLNVMSRVQSFQEKPEITSAVSMGIYVMEPSVIDHIPTSGYFDFPDLVRALLAANEPVGAYRYEGLWFDIGRHEDYVDAVAAWAEDGLATTNGNGNRNGALLVTEFDASGGDA